MDDLFSVENLSKLAGKPEFGIAELPSSSASSSSSTLSPSEPTKIQVPIQVTAGNSTYTLNAEAKINLKVNIDLEALMKTQSIKNRDERLSKMRDLIRMDSSVCELTFT